MEGPIMKVYVLADENIQRITMYADYLLRCSYHLQDDALYESISLVIILQHH